MGADEVKQEKRSVSEINQKRDEIFFQTKKRSQVLVNLAQSSPN